MAESCVDDKEYGVIMLFCFNRDYKCHIEKNITFLLKLYRLLLFAFGWKMQKINTDLSGKGTGDRGIGNGDQGLWDQPVPASAYPMPHRLVLYVLIVW